MALEEIAWLNRVRKLIFYTWLELQEPRWIVPYPIGPRETLPKRAIAVIARSGEIEVPFRYEPPFILVRGGNFKINNFAYRLHFEFREENEKPYWLFVFVSADGNITVRRALLKEKEWNFRDPAFFRIDVSGGGEEDFIGFGVKKILDENATEKTVDEILFSGEIKNGFTPLKRQVNETSGRFMFRDQWCILRFRSKEDLRRLSTLNFTFYI